MHNLASQIRQKTTPLLFCGLTLLSAALDSPCRATPTLQPEEEPVPFVVGPIKPDPARNLVYIVDGTYNRLLAINTDTGIQTAATTVDDGATLGNIAISIDGSKLYLAESTEDEVLVFSLPDLTQLAAIPLSFPPYCLAAGTGGRLYVSTPPNGDSGSIYEISTTDGSILQTVDTGYYYGPVIRSNSTGTHLYATILGISGDLSLGMYDISGTTASTPTEYGYDSENLIDFEPDETYGAVYLMSGGIYGVNVLKTATDNDNTTWPLTGAYGVAVSYNNSSSVVFGASGDPYNGDIREYKRTNGTPIADWVVVKDARPIMGQGIAATANGNLVYVRADDGYDPAPPFVLGLISPLTQPITLVPTLSQTLTFPALSSGTFGESLTLQADSSSGLTVTYTVVSGPATISGNVLTYTGTGAVVIEAIQAGNAVFKAANSTQSTTVSKASQTISSFGVIPNQSYGQPLTLSPPSVSSNLPISVTVKSGPATISGNTLTFTGLGAVTVAADQPGNANYLPAPEITTSFLVGQGSQTITPFTAIASKPANAAPFSIILPTSSSSLPVTVAVQSGPATLNGNLLTLTGPGTVVLAANQPGDANYLAAPAVTTQFDVSIVAQTIVTFPPIAPKSYTPSPFTITSPSASSGLPVQLSVVSGPATINGNSVTLTGVGTVVLAANQPGNFAYSAAAEITTHFTVTKATQTLTPLGPISPQSLASPLTITPPTASSGLPVTVVVKLGPAVLSGSVLTFTGTGRVILAASQLGNADYLAATTEETSLVVNQASQTISAFAPIANQVFGGSPFALAIPTASSGLPVSVAVESGPARIIDGDIVALTGAGPVVLVATQPGNLNYLAAPGVLTTFTVSKATQTISPFPSLANTTYGAKPVTVLPPISSSRLAVRLSVLSGPGKIFEDRVSPTGTGTITLAANQPGSATYQAAPEVTTTLVVNPASQTLAPFEAIDSVTFGAPSFVVAPPSATSKLPVLLSILSGPATIVGETVTATGAGTVVLAADQPGNADYNPATEVTTSFVVNKASQTIGRFALIGVKTTASSPFTVSPPLSTSHLPVTLSVKSGPATINRDTVTLTGPGTVVLAADQAGDTNYIAAPEVKVSFLVR